MTKEELEKEARINLKRRFGEFFPQLTISYVMGAEPREKRIKSLGERCLQLQKDKGNLIDENNELKAQIEKMKNCKNCKKLKKEKDGLLVCTVGSFYTNRFGENCDKWEIKEK